MEYQSLVLDFLEQGDFNAEKLKEYQRAFAKQNGMQTLPSKSQILQAYFQLVEEKKINKNSDNYIKLYILLQKLNLSRQNKNILFQKNIKKILMVFYTLLLY